MNKTSEKPKKASIERLVNPQEQELDPTPDATTGHQTIRPQSFDDFPGQTKVVDHLKVYVDSAKKRKDSLDHVILHGPPGLGKTTLARIIANELGYQFVQTSAPAIDKTGDLAGILASLSPNTVLFVDEIHRLSIVVEELLYSAMEDFAIDFVIGEGPSAKSVRMDIPPFTLIGATTRLANLSSPLVSRFGIQEHMDFYKPEHLTEIILRSAGIMGIDIDQKGAVVLAKRSRGTPRIANRILRRVRDFAEHENQSVIDSSFANKTLDHLEIDQNGLDKMDRRIINVIAQRYDGGPVGIDALASTIGESRNTIEEVYEPFLVHQNIIRRGPRGRELTELGKKHSISPSI